MKRSGEAGQGDDVQWYSIELLGWGMARNRAAEARFREAKQRRGGVETNCDPASREAMELQSGEWRRLGEATTFEAMQWNSIAVRREGIARS